MAETRTANVVAADMNDNAAKAREEADFILKELVRGNCTTNMSLEANVEVAAIRLRAAAATLDRVLKIIVERRS